MLVWGTSGRQFESGHPDSFKTKILIYRLISVVGGKVVGEKSVNFTQFRYKQYSIGHFTQKVEKCQIKIFLQKTDKRLLMRL